MKDVMLSIHPAHVENICTVIGEKNGKPIYKKSIEVRKSRPKIETPFRVFIYMTAGNASYPIKIDGYPYMCHNNGGQDVIGEFVCDRIDEYLCKEYEWEDGDVSLEYRIRSVEGEKTCLDYDEIREYGNEKPLYFWHISDLKIYDKPKKLSEFYTRCNISENKCKLCDDCFDREDSYGRHYAVKKIIRPPQSWCYVEGE